MDTPYANLRNHGCAMTPVFEAEPVLLSYGKYFRRIRASPTAW